LLGSDDVNPKEEALTKTPGQRKILGLQIPESVAWIYRFWLPYRQAIYERTVATIIQNNQIRIEAMICALVEADWNLKTAAERRPGCFELKERFSAIVASCYSSLFIKQSFYPSCVPIVQQGIRPISSIGY